MRNQINLHSDPKEVVIPAYTSSSSSKRERETQSLAWALRHLLTLGTLLQELLPSSNSISVRCQPWWTFTYGLRIKDLNTKIQLQVTVPPAGSLLLSFLPKDVLQHPAKGESTKKEVSL
jgi:hypothetical protein